jgi:hypothetical protein
VQLLVWHKNEEGQGLVDDLPILALVALPRPAGMGSLASYLNQGFSSIRSLLNAYIPRCVEPLHPA